MIKWSDVIAVVEMKIRSYTWTLNYEGSPWEIIFWSEIRAGIYKAEDESTSNAFLIKGMKS